MDAEGGGKSNAKPESGHRSSGKSPNVRSIGHHSYIGTAWNAVKTGFRENRFARKRTLFVWYISMGWSIALLILGFIDAGHNGSSSTGSAAAAFAAIWNGILFFLMGLWGLFVLREYRTIMNFAVLLGLAVMGSQLEFTLFVCFVGYAKHSKEEGPYDIAMAVFLFLQTFTLTLFSFMAWRHRGLVIKGINPDEELQFGANELIASTADEYSVPSMDTGTQSNTSNMRRI
uniref:Uncharacterized protein n=1 Tax=Fibrocapsa japonica TaxID=94617 RepID=A0A7S2V3H6_9STRA|mmetsp:Transcript_23199/g.33710  ORF Transcript_23199/g.33710 Transcript_23199/m.33710 type:complete len:230 (+) Transcript_23199:134-823(+)|eukprot:CAMPEP_0113937776 /NCGR_PEP_ID=MMETSP1339-20121228/4327_1 /TAXON_ID=94617 /ORGANISM="Fibrocapsa japonica" /LENGTH=229 /DNA_ID=CAMNT_0000940675 /DNA_START=28 /DNA_END=717 /DNA_ORIENTATION=- /assembly_acc=CAM_ASM_000762